MKFLKHIPLEKIKEHIKSNPKLIILGGVGILLISLFVFSRHEDERVIRYQSDGKADFSDGRILNSSNDIYQKKEKALSTKFEELEKEIKDLNELVKAQSEKFEGIKKEPSSEELPKEAPITEDPKELYPSPMSDHNSQGAYEVRKVEPQYSQPSNASPSYPPSSYAVPQNYVPSQQGSTVSTPPPIEKKGPEILSFPVKAKTEASNESVVTIPSGSFVKAKLLTGVEAPEGKALPVLLQADYAFVGPNKSRIDLSGCFLIAKSTGNLSIERVEMQASKISCVSKAGRMFEREMNGFIADNKDNSFAVMGEVNSKQDRVASMAFLSSVVAGISGAISQAQTTTSSNAAGGTATLLTGDEQKYIAANGAGNAANIVTQWYLKHAQSLLPTINVGSGKDVWIIVQDSVELPNWYFKKIATKNSGFEFLSKITE